MSIKPVGARLLIEPIQIEEKTSSGIILPSLNNIKSSNTGIVIAVGNIEENIIIGDKIFFKLNSGVEISDSNKKYILLDIENVLAIIK